MNKNKDFLNDFAVNPETSAGMTLSALADSEPMPFDSDIKTVDQMMRESFDLLPVDLDRIKSPVLDSEQAKDLSGMDIPGFWENFGTGFAKSVNEKVNEIAENPELALIKAGVRTAAMVVGGPAGALIEGVNMHIPSNKQKLGGLLVEISPEGSGVERFGKQMAAEASKTLRLYEDTYGPIDEEIVDSLGYGFGTGLFTMLQFAATGSAGKVMGLSKKGITNLIGLASRGQGFYEGIESDVQKYIEKTGDYDLTNFSPGLRNLGINYASGYIQGEIEKIFGPIDKLLPKGRFGRIVGTTAMESASNAVEEFFQGETGAIAEVLKGNDDWDDFLEGQIDHLKAAIIGAGLGGIMAPYSYEAGRTATKRNISTKLLTYYPDLDIKKAESAAESIVSNVENKVIQVVNDEIIASVDAADDFGNLKENFRLATLEHIKERELDLDLTEEEVAQIVEGGADVQSRYAFLDSVERGVSLASHPLNKAVGNESGLWLEGKNPSESNVVEEDINNKQVDELRSRISDAVWGMVRSRQLNRKSEIEETQQKIDDAVSKDKEKQLKQEQRETRLAEIKAQREAELKAREEQKAETAQARKENAERREEIKKQAANMKTANQDLLDTVRRDSSYMNKFLKWLGVDTSKMQAKDFFAASKRVDESGNPRYYRLAEFMKTEEGRIDLAPVQEKLEKIETAISEQQKAIDELVEANKRGMGVRAYRNYKARQDVARAKAEQKKAKIDNVTGEELAKGQDEIRDDKIRSWGFVKGQDIIDGFADVESVSEIDPNKWYKIDENNQWVERTPIEAQKLGYKPEFTPEQAAEIPDMDYQGSVMSTINSQDRKRGLYDRVLKRIVLNELSDASSINHELSHYWVDRNFMYLKSGFASPEFEKRWQEIFDWLGVTEAQMKNKGGLTQAQSEKFARAYEKWLKEGDITNSELKPVFEQFREFTLDVYDDVLEYFDDVGDIPQAALDWFNLNETAGRPEVAIAKEVDNAFEQIGDIETSEETDAQAEVRADTPLGTPVESRKTESESGITPKKTDEFNQGKEVDSGYVKGLEERSQADMGRNRHRRRNLSAAAEAADNYVAKSEEEALEVVKGNKTEPENMHRSEIVKALERKYLGMNSDEGVAKLREFAPYAAEVALNVGRATAGFKNNSDEVGYLAALKRLESSWKNDTIEKNLEKTKRDIAINDWDESYDNQFFKNEECK